jgi:hypothetical protein
MLFAWRDADHVTGSNFFDRAAQALDPTTPGCDDESLAERVGCARQFERQART